MLTYNWTKYALCESTLTGGLQAEAMAFRVSFLKHYTHSNIQLKKVCDLWKYTEWWASSRSNSFQKKSFETLYIFKYTIEQSMRSVKVQWVVGFKQKQGLPEEVFQNIIHIQTYNWTKYALCGSTLTGNFQAEALARIRNFSKHYTPSNIQLTKVWALWKYTDWWVQSEAIAFGRSFSKHYTHSNIQLNKVCALWKSSEWWASSRSKGFQEKFSKHYSHSTYNWKNCALFQSNKVTWVVGFKQKQWLSEEVFWNIINMQT